MHAIRIDRGKPLSAEPHTGHNRYHPTLHRFWKWAKARK